ncbi:hypothetical protein HYDPIDRAFT_119913 [Hydnomerulius pinastri MD-312]|uniref:Uncharacterized protein n=1 Tax=Hydnomerulius pinastri MD-312 TaxID=994086 RepID=A0A0C9UYN6_9AGAM|nr:hypothetical protein HYDPIDRAFT_119913 [Hydnomerulius pinastri MD-312]
MATIGTVTHTGSASRRSSEPEMVHGICRSGSNASAILTPQYELMQPRQTIWESIFGPSH